MAVRKRWVTGARDDVPEGPANHSKRRVGIMIVCVDDKWRCFDGIGEHAPGANGGQGSCVRHHVATLVLILGKDQRRD